MSMPLTVEVDGQSRACSAEARRWRRVRPAQSPNPGKSRRICGVCTATGTRVNGKQYRVLRGDFHRHTELSSDGAGDGRLEDNYRYTLDAAAMDIGYVSDHQMGQDDEAEKLNRITQKVERPVLYAAAFRPHVRLRAQRALSQRPSQCDLDRARLAGAQDCASRKPGRGQHRLRALSLPAPDQKASPPSHTSATDRCTDWRDNDPAVEPVVEIYQGYDNNYEEPNGPRSRHSAPTSSHGPEKPAGYVWNAWAKGYKLGVQSSSDHISTHTSYACVLAENFTREGIMDALRKRHTYAATDNIVMDFEIPNTSAGTALMGDIVSSSAPPKLTVRVEGTAPIKQIDVIKSNKYIYQVKPNQKDAHFEYVDSSIGSGESYYYVRVEQTDGQLAWSSPIWVTYK